MHKANSTNAILNIECVFIHVVGHWKGKHDHLDLDPPVEEE